MKHLFKTNALLKNMLAGAVCVPMSAHSDTGGNTVGSTTEAERMIAACLDYAAAQKLTPLSVGVIDQSGTLVAFIRQPGASIATAEVALLKAKTALRLNAPTSVLAPVAAADASTRDAFLINQMITIPGGVPVADKDGQAVGAVGVSGALPDQDAACAGKAIAALPRKDK